MPELTVHSPRRSQGLVTNDAAPVEPPGAPPVYACILNAQGRYLHDMFLFRTEDATPTLFVDTDASGANDLLRLLKRYRLRQKIDIDDVSADYQIWARFGTPTEISQSSSVETEMWVLDPRLAALGHRAVLPTSAAAPASTGAAAEAPWQAYRDWRLAHGVGEGDSEIPSGEAVALEYNVDGLHGISFSKGCYVGQELMARTHFKGVIRKRAMPFEVLGEQGARLSVGEAVFDPGAGDRSAGKALGTVRALGNGVGLAHVRLGGALAAVDAGRTLMSESGVELRVWRPDWWPESWGREEG